MELEKTETVITIFDYERRTSRYYTMDYDDWYNKTLDCISGLIQDNSTSAFFIPNTRSLEKLDCFNITLDKNTYLKGLKDTISKIPKLVVESDDDDPKLELKSDSENDYDRTMDEEVVDNHVDINKITWMSGLINEAFKYIKLEDLEKDKTFDFLDYRALKEFNIDEIQNLVCKVPITAYVVFGGGSMVLKPFPFSKYGTLTRRDMEFLLYMFNLMDMYISDNEHYIRQGGRSDLLSATVKQSYVKRLREFNTYIAYFVKEDVGNIDIPYTITYGMSKYGCLYEYMGNYYLPLIETVFNVKQERRELDEDDVFNLRLALYVNDLGKAVMLKYPN